MNEILFFLHSLIVLVFTLGALKLGKKALFSWICLQSILANLFVLKQIDWFNYTITCSDVYAIGGILGLNLLQEYFGKKSSKQAVFASFYLMIFFSVMTKIHLMYVPSEYDTTQLAYHAILSSTPRILLASIATFFLVQQVDFRLFGKLKAVFPHLPLAIRNSISLLISQLLDTLLFSFFGLFGLVSHLWDIIFISFTIKAIVILLSIPFLAFSRKFSPKPYSTSL